MKFLNRLFGRRAVELDPEGARRLARLLVAEIRSFESYKLERGIETKNILGVLETEIAAAREKFLDAFSGEAASTIFDAQLLSVLADGDPSLLGQPNS